MSVTATAVAMVCAGVAAALASPWPVRGLDGRGSRGAAPAETQWWMSRYRLWLVLAAGSGGWVMVGGLWGLPAAIGAGWWCWRGIGRAESEADRRRVSGVEADLPILTHLVAIGLRAGLDPVGAVDVAAAALPGPAADEVRIVTGSQVLSGDPRRVWERVASVPGLEPLGRCFLNAGETGSSVVVAIERLGVELGRRQRGGVEDRARQVGVKAAVPLGLCLLPAFLLIGIVPLVGGLVTSLG